MLLHQNRILLVFDALLDTRLMPAQLEVQLLLTLSLSIFKRVEVLDFL